jgi:type IV conjugative transfer system coupling protein TraD
MALEEPKIPWLKTGKKPRNDIRNNKRPIPQEHHSSRGNAPRNSGNFTRGSQLLTTQILMWLQGIKMPAYMWLGVFVIACSTILAITLDENNIQLIAMRILSGIWEWISFDELKRINLRMPDDSVRHTYMGYVPFVPEVILAWHKAVKGFIGALVVASCITVPLSIWYVEFSARRGKAMIQERHERGAMLVDRDLLYSEIATHNKIEFVKEAARLYPGQTPEQVLKLKFKARKAGGIHHPYSLAGIPFPHRLEQSHFMTLGTTGSGKTTLFRKLLQQMRERDDTAVVFDLTGAYVEAFYDPERDTILNPADARCPAWTIFNDCHSYSDFTAAAGALIPSDGGATDPFWALAARTLFTEMCMKLIEKGLTSNKALSDNLMTADLKLVHKHLANTIADPITAPEAAKMAESIRAVFNTNAQALRFLPDDGPQYSIRDWMTAKKKPGSILFITCNYTDLEMNRALLTLWSNLAIHSLMTMKRTRNLHTWFVFDELGALHRLPAIENGLQTARNFGGAMVLGLHSFDKLVQVYGQENARNLSSLARTKLILAAADLDTAEQGSRYIGNREIRQMDEGYSYGYNNTRDASTLTPRKQIEPLVIPDDIMNLPSLHGFVKFPDGFPAARISLEWEHYPTVAEGFILRKPSKPDEAGTVVREGAGKPQRGDNDVGRGDVPGATEEVTPANEANNFATNIRSQATEGQVENARGETPVEATVRNETQVLLADMRNQASDGDRDDRTRSLKGQSPQSRSGGTQHQKDDPTPTGERPENLSIREARDAFPDDGYGL